MACDVSDQCWDANSAASLPARGARVDRGPAEAVRSTYGLSVSRTGLARVGCDLTADDHARRRNGRNHLCRNSVLIFERRWEEPDRFATRLSRGREVRLAALRWSPTLVARLPHDIQGLVSAGWSCEMRPMSPRWCTPSPASTNQCCQSSIVSRRQASAISERDRSTHPGSVFGRAFPRREMSSAGVLGVCLDVEEARGEFLWGVHQVLREDREGGGAPL